MLPATSLRASYSQVPGEDGGTTAEYVSGYRHVVALSAGDLTSHEDTGQMFLLLRSPKDWGWVGGSVGRVSDNFGLGRRCPKISSDGGSHGMVFELTVSTNPT
jgi:hypothetical protein